MNYGRTLFLLAHLGAGCKIVQTNKAGEVYYLDCGSGSRLPVYANEFSRLKANHLIRDLHHECEWVLTPVGLQLYVQLLKYPKKKQGDFEL